MKAFSRYLKAILLQGLAALISVPASAQAPHVQKMSLNHPVGDHIFNTAVQDRNGFIWLGSDKGLFRYDGREIKQFTPEEDSVDFKVLSIHESRDGILWIGCRDGSIFRLSASGLTAFEPQEGTAGTGISDLITGADGTIWWSTLGEGIYFYVNDRVYNINHEDGLREDYVYDLLVDGTGKIWAGTDGGVAICSQEDGHKKVEIPEWNDELPDLIVKVLESDDSGNIYLGFYESLPGYISKEGHYFVDLSPDPGWPFGPISDMVVLKDGIWISTVSGKLVELGKSGLYEMAEGKGPGKAGEKFGKISRMLPDREGNLWIIAATGLYRTTGSKWKFYDQFENISLQNIHAIYYDHDHKLWFSNEEGLFLADPATGKSKKFLETKEFKDVKVTCLNQDPYGYIWAGTFNYGVFRINPANGSWTRVTEKEGLVNNNVLSISRHDDTLWMATLGGSTQIVLESGPGSGMKSIQSFNRTNGLVSNYIYSVFEDRENRIWFATDGDGISVMDKGHFTTYGKDKGLGDDVVYSISGDDEGNIWIATAQAGVYRFDGRQFSRFGIEEGLSSLQITGLVTSGNEVIVIMENGLDIIHKPTGRIIHYGEEIGLAGISPDLNVVSKDPEGNLWIGTKNGIIRYQPEKNESSSGPLTKLEQMSVYMEEIDMKDNLVLGSNRNHISFNYSGIWLSNPEKVSFQVMLEGYDLGWKNTYDRSAVYSSLPAGHYTFRVRSSASQSFRNSSEASFSFRIRQPFWTSLWFILPVIIFVAFLIYLYIFYREKQLRRKEAEKKEKVEFEFQVLKNQVNPHFLFNSFSTLMALIEEQPKQALEYTEKLSDFFRTILQLKDEEVIPIKEELHIIEDYFFLLKKRFGDNVDLEILLDDRALESFIPPMTLQILIENAVKHNVISKEKPLKIKIYSTTQEINVENNIQLKKTPEVSTGIGLENISKRYRLKAGKEPGIERTGDFFRVKLPLIE